MYLISPLKAGGGHGMGNAVVQDKGRKQYELRHVHPAAYLGKSGRASGEPERWGSAPDRDTPPLGLAFHAVYPAP
jgi:hypothetical protein